VHPALWIGLVWRVGTTRGSWYSGDTSCWLVCSECFAGLVPSEVNVGRPSLRRCRQQISDVLAFVCHEKCTECCCKRTDAATQNLLCCLPLRLPPARLASAWPSEVSCLRCTLLLFALGRAASQATLLNSCHHKSRMLAATHVIIVITLGVGPCSVWSTVTINAQACGNITVGRTRKRTKNLAGTEPGRFRGPLRLFCCSAAQTGPGHGNDPRF